MSCVYKALFSLRCFNNGLLDSLLYNKRGFSIKLGPKNYYFIVHMRIRHFEGLTVVLMHYLMGIIVEKLAYHPYKFFLKFDDEQVL